MKLILYLDSSNFFTCLNVSRFRKRLYYETLFAMVIILIFTCIIYPASEAEITELDHSTPRLFLPGGVELLEAPNYRVSIFGILRLLRNTAFNNLPHLPISIVTDNVSVLTQTRFFLIAKTVIVLFFFFYQSSRSSSGKDLPSSLIKDPLAI